jgi:hypothetical protein
LTGRRALRRIRSALDCKVIEEAEENDDDDDDVEEEEEEEEEENVDE